MRTIFEPNSLRRWRQAEGYFAAPLPPCLPSDGELVHLVQFAVVSAVLRPGLYWDVDRLIQVRFLKLRAD